MTRNYVSNDGQRYEAMSVSALVNTLWRESHQYVARQTMTKGEWRADAAYRASEASGHTVRGDSDLHFVEDLLNAGLLKEEG